MMEAIESLKKRQNAQKLKEKYTNRHASMLGFEQPEGFSEQSRVLIKKKLHKTKQNTSIFSVRALRAMSC